MLFKQDDTQNTTSQIDKNVYINCFLPYYLRCFRDLATGVIISVNNKQRESFAARLIR
jgi:hypothetical protein